MLSRQSKSTPRTKGERTRDFTDLSTRGPLLSSTLDTSFGAGLVRTLLFDSLSANTWLPLCMSFNNNLHQLTNQHVDSYGAVF